MGRRFRLVRDFREVKTTKLKNWATHMRCFSVFDRLQLLLEMDEAEWAAFRREEEDREAWD